MKTKLNRLTRTNMSSSDLRRFSSFSISVWQVWQTYRWLTAGPPPYLRGEFPFICTDEIHDATKMTCMRGLWMSKCFTVPAVKVIPHVLWQHHHQVVNESCLVGWHTWWNTLKHHHQTLKHFKGRGRDVVTGEIISLVLCWLGKIGSQYVALWSNTLPHFFPWKSNQ